MIYLRKHWDSTIDNIVKNNLTEELISANWTVKDVINHITWYEKELADALENKSVVESEFWNMSVEERNQMIFDNTQDMRLKQILEESKMVFAKLFSKIENLTEEDLNSESFVKRKSGTRITHDFIGGITFWHYEDHEDALINHFDFDY